MDVEECTAFVSRLIKQRITAEKCDTSQETKDLAWKTMCRNFDSLIDTSEFLGLEKNDLLSLLADKSLRCRESSVFSGVCNWVRADQENRKQHMKELFSLVRLSCLKKDYLMDTVGKELLVTEDKECFQIYVDCIEDILVRGPRPSRDRGMKMNWKASGEWTHGPKLDMDLYAYRCSAVVFDDKIYCASGEKQMAILSNGNWHLFASPSNGPEWKLCVVADSMYAIGGAFGKCCNVYKFEKGSETWTLVHSASVKYDAIVSVSHFNDRICVANKDTKNIEILDTNNAESGFVRLCAYPPGLSDDFLLCVVDGRLMTVGGYADSNYTNKVYVWNPQTDSWNAETALGETRRSMGATVCDGRLVIVGGHNGGAKRDVQMLVDGEWKQLPSLQHARYECGVVVHDNILYAIGGYGAGWTVEMLVFDEE